MSVVVNIATTTDGAVLDLTITNVGHADGYPADARRYAWTSLDGQRGTVIHRRSHGIVKLVCAVLEEIGDMRL